MLTLDKVFDAQRVLKNIVRETSCVRASGIAPGVDLWLKPENLQNTGSFKLRGSGYKMANLTEEEKKRGVVACSAGNHAQGVALAASKQGIKSVICLPDSAPISKIEATKAYGAEVCLVEGVYDDAYNKALELRDSMGYTFVHPFDDEDVIAGQGTIALEIFKDLDDIDAIIVPVGGGGLISGIAPSMVKSIGGGAIERLPSVMTIADGIAVKQPGENTFRYVKEYVDDMAVVTEDEICSAILTLIEKQKMVAEGAGAVSVAAAMFNKFPVQGKKIVSVVSGGNIDVTILSRIIKRGLMKSGRVTNLLIELIDKPGQLKEVSRIIADLGGNVTSVHHERAGDTENINGCYLRVSMETRDYDHVNAIKNALKDEGLKVVDSIKFDV